MFSKRSVSSFLFVVCLSTGCAHREKPSGGAVAILPFENLSADAGLNWVGRGSSVVLRDQLTGTAWAPVEAQSTEAARAPQTLTGYVTERNGQLFVNAVLRNASSQTVDSEQVHGPASGGVLPLLNQVAKHFSPNAKPYGTSNEQAARALFVAAASPNSVEMLAQLDAALAADPHFAAAHMTKIEVLQGMGRKDDARAAIEDARRNSSAFPPRDRAKLEYLAASITGDKQKRTQALEELVRENPHDIRMAQTLAESCVQARNYKCAIDALNGALKIEPKNIALWNSLGYAEAYAGDLAGAQKALEQYRALAPNDANAWDSMGEIHFLLGKYTEAEQEFLEAHKRNPAMLQGGHLYRAALAHLMTGDTMGADAAFQKYIDFRKQAQDQAIEVRTGIWQFQSGRADAALATFDRIAKANGQWTSFALVESAFVLLEQGKRDAAHQKAVGAGQSAANPAARTLAIVSQVLSAPSAPTGEWRRRIEAVVQQERPREQMLGYALTYDGHYADSIPVWKSLFDAMTPETGSEEKTMLALAYTKTGNKAEAQSLLRTGIFLPRNPEPGLDAFVYPRFRSLK